MSGNIVVDPVVGEGVRATIAAYAQALDDGRTDDVVAQFCIDGVCDLPGFGIFEGHDAIRDAFLKWKPVRPQRHMVFNTLITDREGDEVTAVSDLSFSLHDGKAWSILMIGRYHDTFRLVGDRWLIAYRATAFEEG